MSGIESEIFTQNVAFGNPQHIIVGLFGASGAFAPGVYEFERSTRERIA